MTPPRGVPTADCLTVGPLIGGCATDLQRVSPDIGRTRASVRFDDPQIKDITKRIAQKLTLNGTGAAGRTGVAEEVPVQEPEAPGRG